MKSDTKASVYSVGQKSSPAVRPRPLREVKISLRITQKMADKKPSKLSWSDYLERLQAKRQDADLSGPERTRYAAWAAVSLDRLNSLIARAISTAGAEPVGATLNRLEAIANLNQEMACVRRILEEIYVAR